VLEFVDRTNKCNLSLQMRLLNSDSASFGAERPVLDEGKLTCTCPMSETSRLHQSVYTKSWGYDDRFKQLFDKRGADRNMNFNIRRCPGI
jgi:hypothetical protein